MMPLIPIFLFSCICVNRFSHDAAHTNISFLQMQLRRQKRHQGEQAFVTDRTDDLDLED